MIDPNVHFRDWEQSDKETVAHGLMTATMAGFTHVFDMPDCSPALTDYDTLLKRLELTNKPGYHIYAGLTANPVQIEDVLFTCMHHYPRIAAVSLFTGPTIGNMGVTEKEDQLKVFKTLARFRYKGVVAVHCEKESLLKPELYVPGKFETHSLAHPPESEYESVNDILTVALEAKFKGLVHIAHASCAQTVAYVREFRREGLRVSMGVTPQHALLNTEDARNHDRYLKMNPPLRDEANREAIFKSLLDGCATWVESDHSPHTLQDKEDGANGIPGFAGMLVLIEALRKAKCSEAHIEELFCYNAARAFGIEVTDRDLYIPEDSEETIEELRSEYPFHVW